MAIGAYQSFIIVNIMNLPVYLGLPLGIITGFLINSIIYIAIIKPLTDKHGNKVMLTLATLGLSIALTGLIQVTAHRMREIYGLYSFAFLLKMYDFSLFGTPGVFIISSVTAFLVYMIWRHIYRNTESGLNYRAILENPELAQIQGINIDRTWLFVWGFSGSLACLAGSLSPLWYSISTNSGTQIITAVIAASLLGGLKNSRGFFIGGLMVGVFEIMITWCGMENLGMWFGEYRPFIPMVIIVLVLGFRPQGLFGSINES